MTGLTMRLSNESRRIGATATQNGAPVVVQTEAQVVFNLKLAQESG